jgi:hypothetical protein
MESTRQRCRDLAKRGVARGGPVRRDKVMRVSCEGLRVGCLFEEIFVPSRNVRVDLLTLDALDQFRRVVIEAQFGILIQHTLGSQPRSLIVAHSQHRVGFVHFFLC